MFVAENRLFQLETYNLLMIKCCFFLRLQGICCFHRQRRLTWQLASFADSNLQRWRNCRFL